MGDALFSVALSSSGQISITDIQPANSDSQYITSSHTINLGAALSGGSDKLENLFVHEAGHADLGANGVVAGTVDEEAQAYLIMGKFAQEANPGYHLSWTPLDGDGNPTSTSGGVFNGAAESIMNNGFDNNHFDTFAENFKSGSSMNSDGVYNGLTDYDSQNPDTVPYVSTLFIMDSITPTW